MIPEIFESERCGITLDLAGVPLGPAELIERSLDSMRALEAGALANPSEGRQVGHFWLRAPALAPDPALGLAIRGEQEAVARFAATVDAGCDTVLLCGIGGSALGPELLCDALGTTRRLLVMDNADPAGIARTLGRLDPGRTLVVVASKSGGTRETALGLELVARRFAEAGVALAPRAAAVTLPASVLARRAEAEGWRRTFRLWDWVGGRFSVSSAVGLLPGALCGVDVDGFLRGASQMDEETRLPDPARNPAALLALAWWAARQQGRRAMALIPYADRLSLLTRYLQQLIMESLGKSGEGLAVYGNKGSTDQHALMQQLYEGPDDALIVLLEVRNPGPWDPELEPGVRASDHLAALCHGSRAALRACGRPTAGLFLERLDAASLGAVLALFERAVGLYATMLGLNAYDQPAVELGKRAAERILALQRTLEAALAGGGGASPAEWAARIGGDPGEIRHQLARLRAQGRVPR